MSVGWLNFLIYTLEKYRIYWTKKRETIKPFFTYSHVF